MEIKIISNKYDVNSSSNININFAEAKASEANFKKIFMFY